MKTFTNYEIAKMKQRVANAFSGKNFTKKRLEQFLLMEKNDSENKKYCDLHRQLYSTPKKLKVVIPDSSGAEAIKIKSIPQARIYGLSLLDDFDRDLVNLLKDGLSQPEISGILKNAGITPNSLSSIEKRLKAIRERFGAYTNFHLAVILFGK